MGGGLIAQSLHQLQQVVQQLLILSALQHLHSMAPHLHPPHMLSQGSCHQGSLTTQLYYHHCTVTMPPSRTVITRASRHYHAITALYHWCTVTTAHLWHKLGKACRPQRWVLLAHSHNAWPCRNACSAPYCNTGCHRQQAGNRHCTSAVASMSMFGKEKKAKTKDHAALVEFTVSQTQGH